MSRTMARLASLRWCATLGLLATAFALAGGTPARGSLMLSITGPKAGEHYISVGVSFNGIATNVYAGIQVASLNSGPAFDSYCVDFYHDNNLPLTYTVSADHVANLGGSNGSGGLYAGNGNKVGYLYQTDAVGASNDSQKAAGLQLAIWSAEYGSHFVISSSQSPGDATAAAGYAATYLADLNSHYNASTVYDAALYVATHSPSTADQDMIGPPGSLPAVATPEPSTLFGAATAVVLGLGYSWHRRKRAAD